MKLFYFFSNVDFKDYSEKVGFKSQPVGVRKGNEKGRVERAICYIRGNFFAGRDFKNIHDLNEQARQWCEKEATMRRKPDDPSLTIANALLLKEILLCLFSHIFHPQRKLSRQE